MNSKVDNIIDIPIQYNEIDIIFNKLCNIPQYEQRTTEWYEYRKHRITASDTAVAIDLNPYECSENFIVNKCEGSTMIDNAAMFHGRKYEHVANAIYENIYDVKVKEFGALPSDIYNFLGASPDGICDKYTLDNKN